MSDSRTVVKLRHPVQNGSETVAELSFRRPRAKDWRGVDMVTPAVRFDSLLLLAERLSGQTTHVIDSLEQDDFQEVLSVVAGFTQGGPPTG